MALTDKIYDLGKKAVITAAVLATLPNYSDAQLLRRRTNYQNPQTIERRVEVEKQKVPSYEEFRDLLKKKGKYDPEKEERLRAFWGKLKEDVRILEYSREDKIEAYIKRYSEKDRKAIEEIKLDEEIIKNLPWKSNPNDLVDKCRAFDLINAIKIFEGYNLIPKF